MKDVKQCSISSVAFTLEIDAYQTLYDYIEAIRNRYANDADADEILSDIEGRIAELILSVHSADRVVAKPLIDTIIKQMGSVDDICGEAPASEDAPTEEERKSHRRLYRNIDDAPIGGVCAGIAAYLGCSVVLVRVIALLLLIGWGASLWLYIILWVAVPAAVTARQKLEMRGEPVTASSIRDFYNSLEVDKKTRSVLGSIVVGIGKIILFFAKFILGCMLIGLLVLIIGAIVALFAVIISDTPFVDFVMPVVALLSVVLLMGIAIYAIIAFINSRRVKAWPIVLALVLWLLLAITSAVLISQNTEGIKDRFGLIHWNKDVSIRINSESCDKMDKLEQLEQNY